MRIANFKRAAALPGVLLGALALSACRPPQPFPSERLPLPHAKIASQTWHNRVEVLRERGKLLENLTGIVQVAIDSPGMSGSVDVIVVHEEPDRTHFQIVKGLRLDARPLYDLTLAGSRYRLVTYDENQNETTSAGAVEDLEDKHPEIALLTWMRDLMFLPERHATRGFAGECPDALTLGWATTDRAILYELDCETLAVLGLETVTSHKLELWYAAYRPVLPALHLPFRVAARAPAGWCYMEAVVVEAEINGEIPEGVFDISTPEGGHD